MYILLVDDQREVREMLCTVLLGQKHGVIDCAEPLAALEILRSSDDPIDLLITDVQMPKMSGGILAQEARKLYPELPILFISGFHNDAIVNDMVSSGTATCLPKPFPIKDILRIINDIKR